MVDIIANRPIRFAVCGAGRIGIRHMELLQQNPDTELVATTDLRSAAETGTATFRVPHYDSLEALLNSDTEIDVVSIATPNGLHVQQALACLNAGLHVVIEKPMALRKSDAEMLIHTALQKNRLVFGVMQNRYSPPSVWLKEIVERGILGDIYLVQTNCFWNRDERYYQADKWHGTKDMDGGTLFTQFSHFVDMIYWLFGDFVNISGRFANFSHGKSIEFEDTGLVQFDFTSGGSGTLQYSTSVRDANLESSMTIIAERGSIKVAGQYMNEVVHCNIQDYTMPELHEGNPPNDYGVYKGSAANHVQVFRNVVDVLRGRESISTNALEGLKVVEIIERIYAVRDAANR